MKRLMPAYSTASIFASALCGFLFLYAAVQSVLALLDDSLLLSPNYRRDVIILLISTCSALLSAIYFFTALRSSTLRTVGRIALDFFPVIWAVMALATIYFDFSHAMNDPNKVILQLALMAVMVFFRKSCACCLAAHNRAPGCFLAILVCCSAASVGWPGC